MNIEEQKERIKQKRETLRRELLALENKRRGAERKADAHLKLAIGAAVLANIEAGKLSAASAALLIRLAENGIQKEGAGRDKFEALKSKYPIKIDQQK